MITIYSKDNCSFCTRAKNLMKSRDIAFTEKLLNRDFDVDEYVAWFPGIKTFPLIKYGDRIIGGYIELVEEVATNPSFGKLLLNEINN